MKDDHDPGLPNVTEFPTPPPPETQLPVTEPAPDNLGIWDLWAKTPPQFTKKVSLGPRNFTAISPYWQFEQATRIFGPIGRGWGWQNLRYEILRPSDDLGDALLLLRVDLWYMLNSEISTIPLENVAELYQWRKAKNAYEIDTDLWKKLLTDTLTKGFSFLGCSADVFQGLYDDHRYVAQMNAEKWDADRHAWAEDNETTEPPATATETHSAAPETANGSKPGKTPAPKNTAAQSTAQAPAQAPDQKKKKEVFAALVSVMEPFGICQESISRHIKTEHGWSKLSEVPVQYLDNLLGVCRDRVNAYKKLETSAKFLFGQAWQDALSDIIDREDIDLLATDPARLLEMAEKMDEESKERDSKK
ncbi:MAG TPA: hypothetical protein PLE60_14215 [Candidatus Latescibacteria bacterium]|nr:hypothetical protein [Candidatus Latescibacterota bacterium]